MGGGVQKWGLVYYIEVFLDIPHDAAQGKNLDMCILSLLTKIWCKVIAYIKYEMIDIVIAVLIIHADKENSVRKKNCFYLSYNVNKHVLNNYLINDFLNDFLNLFYILL